MSSFKIASLLFRTLSKPVANALKQQAKSHDIFRSLCINVAQIAHRTEMNWKMKVLGYKKEIIRPLNDARAIDAGANFLGEAFIFSVALSLIFAEQVRSRKQAKRQRNAVDDRLEELERDMAEHKEELARVKEERGLLRQELGELTQETDTLSGVLMQVLGREMEKRGVARGHQPAQISQEMVERFENGENVDSSLREAIQSSTKTA
ncbi:optic atrophy 3 protein-domain-containing protein [Kickxella alabastrina]|uniref:optic atrophy 3 protein-domain-containing protein n=1 Tax=Kickxella alabastrina TaxID=61397 RepID=UPI002220AB57|nr:optic atrophy 3 protein-domain-containing protein [Kickxella alabastrina]KAI7834598.1 optic atrophy 3 protein-domain-containing protein [Kickxella alabastrina]